jgi:hypothetical protein
VFDSKGLDQPVSGNKVNYRAITEVARQYLMNDSKSHNTSHSTGHKTAVKQ